MLLIIINFVCCLVTVVVNLFLLCWANVWCNDGTNQQIEKLIQSVLLFPILLSVLIDNINFK